MRATAAISLLLLALISVTGGACQPGADADPPLQEVPLTRGTSAPAEQTQGTMPGRAAPLSPDNDGVLPPDHPPLPSSDGRTLPPNHPPLPEGQAAAPFAQQNAPFAAAPGESNLHWTAPGTWVEEAPSTNMRLTQWRVGTSQSAGPAECYMSRFAGAGGSIDDNLNRWIGQFQQPDGSPSADRAVRGTETVNGLAVTTLTLNGTFQSRNPPMSGPVVDMPGFAMYGAIIETPEGPYFLKCTGPESTLAAEQAGIQAMVQSFAAP